MKKKRREENEITKKKKLKISQMRKWWRKSTNYKVKFRVEKKEQKDEGGRGREKKNRWEDSVVYWLIIEIWWKKLE